MLAQERVEGDKDFVENGFRNYVSKINDLDDEVRALSDTKADLLDIERTLLFKIDEEIKRRKQERELLKVEVTELKNSCERLVNLLNGFQ
jgi:hypothetical protein